MTLVRKKKKLEWNKQINIRVYQSLYFMFCIWRQLMAPLYYYYGTFYMKASNGSTVLLLLFLFQDNLWLHYVIIIIIINLWLRYIIKIYVSSILVSCMFGFRHYTDRYKILRFEQILWHFFILSLRNEKNWKILILTE